MDDPVATCIGIALTILILSVTFCFVAMGVLLLSGGIEP